MKLVYAQSKTPVYVSDQVNLSSGELFTITAIIEPHKPESTGRVVGIIKGASYENSYFPGVIGAEWQDRDDQD